MTSFHPCHVWSVHLGIFPVVPRVWQTILSEGVLSVLSWLFDYLIRQLRSGRRRIQSWWQAVGLGCHIVYICKVRSGSSWILAVIQSIWIQGPAVWRRYRIVCCCLLILRHFSKKIWCHQSISTQPPIFLPPFLSHEWIKVFSEPSTKKVTFSATNHRFLDPATEFWTL